MKLDVTTQLKHCNKCQRDLPASAYSEDRSRRDGLNHTCKLCTSALGKAWREANQEREQLARKVYYEAHKDEQLTRIKTYYAEHKAELAIYSKEWHAAHPEYARKNVRVRRASKRRAPNDGTATPAAIAALKATWTGTCPRCGKEAEPHVDHIISLKAGGAESIHNMQLLCKSCNSAKGAYRT